MKIFFQMSDFFVAFSPENVDFLEYEEGDGVDIVGLLVVVT
jgi:hypothetical protein